MNYLIQFLISGTVVVSAVYLSNAFDQKWAGLIVAMPLSTLLAYVFLSFGNNESHQEYLHSVMLFAIPALIFVGSLYFFEGKVHFLTNIVIGLMVFTPLALIINKVLG